MGDFFSIVLSEKIDYINDVFSLCQVNIRSIPDNFGRLETYLLRLNVGFELWVAGISETLLNVKTVSWNKYLGGYNLA